MRNTKQLDEIMDFYKVLEQEYHVYKGTKTKASARRLRKHLLTLRSLIVPARKELLIATKEA